MRGVKFREHAYAVASGTHRVNESDYVLMALGMVHA